MLTNRLAHPNFASGMLPQRRLFAKMPNEPIWEAQPEQTKPLPTPRSNPIPDPKTNPSNSRNTASITSGDERALGLTREEGNALHQEWARALYEEHGDRALGVALNTYAELRRRIRAG